MKLCILDPAHNIPGLTRIFPDADYYAHQPSHCFNCHWTNHMTNDDFQKHYGFRYKTNWSDINSYNYDYIFIVYNLYDALTSDPRFFKQDVANMLSLVYDIVRQNAFRKVVVFDVYDYDYDPTLYPNQPVDIFFKRNYSLKKEYSPNVFPFPTSMFLRPCVLWTILDYVDKPLEHVPKIREAVWIGGTYIHTDSVYGIVRNREAIYNEIKGEITTFNGVSHTDFCKILKSYALCVDLIGVGDPNKRTFEIFSSGSLWMTNMTDFNWGFKDGDAFSDLCYFSNKEEFIMKKQILLNNDDIYMNALENQNRLVQKYFNKDALRSYIVNKASLAT
jgi:hypothetical protein